MEKMWEVQRTVTQLKRRVSASEIGIADFDSL